MILIDTQTQAKLDRFARLKEIGEYDDHYHDLREELTEEFFPLVERLVKSGLITVSINGDGFDPFSGGVGGAATKAFLHGVGMCSCIGVHADHIEQTSSEPFSEDQPNKEVTS